MSTAEVEPMGWRCADCGAPFEHGRLLVEHLLGEHPEITPWVTT